MARRPDIRDFATYRMREGAYESEVNRRASTVTVEATFVLIDSHATCKLYYLDQTATYVWAFPFGTAEAEFEDLGNTLVNPRLYHYAHSEYLLAPGGRKGGPSSSG